MAQAAARLNRHYGSTAGDPEPQHTQVRAWGRQVLRANASITEPDQLSSAQRVVDEELLL